MTKITLKGSPIHTSGQIPAMAKNFTLVDKDLNNKTLNDFRGKKKVITTVPSLDTGVCSLMTKHLNDLAKKHPQVIFITVSADLPFAQARFCKAEGVQNVLTLSMMRDKSFGQDYGLLILDGPLAGILARSVFVVDEQDKIIYSQIVPEITQEADFSPIANIL
jgi:thiol peroxidase